MSKNKETSLFDDAKFITSVIIALIIITVLLSQSWAISSNLDTMIMIRSILNHNSFYILLLIYFVGIKLSVGKKYFNYLNLFLMLLYFINTISSLLTVIQAFTLNSLLIFLINIVIIIYLVHTMFRGTRVWKDYKLSNSPFNEITNEWYYDYLFIVPTILFIVNLIASTSINGCILALLDYLYILLFSRYIYLYREFLDKKEINSDNKGNFDEIKKNIEDTTNDIKDKVDDFIEDNKIDEKVETAKDKVVDTANDIKDKVDDFIEDNKIDEKVEAAKDKVVDATNSIKDKVKETTKKEVKPKKKSSKKKGSE